MEANPATLHKGAVLLISTSIESAWRDEKPSRPSTSNYAPTELYQPPPAYHHEFTNPREDTEGRKDRTQRKTKLREARRQDTSTLPGGDLTKHLTAHGS
uniref:Uncharacterized protein n=1 Tax=Arundo donax TaxID=35708 RepID=A0A0A8Z278_ARUDO